MEQPIETLFITHEEFKGYTEREQFEFLKKMKRHRLMRHQAVAWGFGENYLSQHYFKLRTNTKPKTKSRALGSNQSTKKKKEPIQKIQLKTTEEVKEIEKESKVEGKTEKLNAESVKVKVKVKAERKEKEKDEEVVSYIPINEKTQPKKASKPSVVRVSAESVHPDSALSLLSTLRSGFADSVMEYKLIDTEEGCDLLFVATGK